MKETKDNYYNHNETYEAKLRNALSPLYGLSGMISIYNDADESKKEDIFKLITESAEIAEQNKAKVKKLLLNIETENEKRIIGAQIEILEQHTQHPDKPGYNRTDILDTIKELKSKL